MGMRIARGVRLLIPVVQLHNVHTMKEKGFTLIELLLYVGILAIIVLATSAFFVMVLQARTKNGVILQVEQEGLRIMDIMTQEVRNAESVTSPTVGASGSSLTLNVVDGASNPTVFGVSSGTMTITQGANPVASLTSDLVTVSGVTFSNRSYASTPGIVQIVFTLSYNNDSGRNEYSYQKTFTGSAALRNY